MGDASPAIKNVSRKGHGSFSRLYPTQREESKGMAPGDGPVCRRPAGGGTPAGQPSWFPAARPASNRATGTRNGEQDT